MEPAPIPPMEPSPPMPPIWARAGMASPAAAIRTSALNAIAFMDPPPLPTSQACLAHRAGAGTTGSLYIRPMAHNNGQVPKPARGKAKARRQPGFSEGAARFEAAVAAVPIAPAGTAYDPAPPTPPATNGEFVPHRPERPEKSEGGKRFKLVSEYEPAGDQPTAIAELVAGARANERDQVLLGVTGSGKTFTMAKVIEAVQRPALDPGPQQDAGRAAL